MRPQSVALLSAAMPSPNSGSASARKRRSKASVEGGPSPWTKFEFVGGGLEGEGQQAAREGAAPQGVTPLAARSLHDDDFYQDVELWSDPRYFRCNSPSTLQAMWDADARRSRAAHRLDAAGERVLGPLRDRLSARGNRLALSVQDARRSITRRLLAETKARAGPRSTRARTRRPTGTGATAARSRSIHGGASGQDVRRRPDTLAEPPQWFFTSINQTSTILSLLTPEYRRRTVQMHYHQSVNNAPLWPGTVLLARRLHAVVLAPGASLDGLRHDAGARAAHGEQRGKLHPALQRGARRST